MLQKNILVFFSGHSIKRKQKPRSRRHPKTVRKSANAQSVRFRLQNIKWNAWLPQTEIATNL